MRLQIYGTRARPRLAVGSGQPQPCQPTSPARRLGLLPVRVGCAGPLRRSILDRAELFVQVGPLPGDLRTFQRQFDFRLSQLLLPLLLQPLEPLTFFPDYGVVAEDLVDRGGVGWRLPRRRGFVLPNASSTVESRHPSPQ